MIANTARFTDEFLTVLLAQAEPFAGATDELRALQAEGMAVQKILPNGRINVTFMHGEHRQYRTFSPRDLVLSGD